LNTLAPTVKPATAHFATKHDAQKPPDKKPQNLLPVDVWIAAGGTAQRLKPLSLLTHKALLPLDKEGKVTMLDKLLSTMSDLPVGRLYLNIRSEMLDVFKKWSLASPKNFPITYQTDVAQGNLYGLLKAIKDPHTLTARSLLFTYGDQFTDVSLRDIVKQHQKGHPPLTIGILPQKERHAQKPLEGNEVKHRQLIRVHDRLNVKAPFVNIAVYVIDMPTFKAHHARFLKWLATQGRTEENVKIKAYRDYLMAEGLPIGAYVFKGDVHQVNTPADYFKLLPTV
jgi:NDP-sugar pyrophosphorylase family protein